tara:strand:- start:219 stop:443 length:225 start_codon:yes stop_codon:yes gene_type:complete
MGIYLVLDVSGRLGDPLKVRNSPIEPQIVPDRPGLGQDRSILSVIWAISTPTHQNKKNSIIFLDYLCLDVIMCV